MLDVTNLLGAGWKVDDSATVTVANQMTFSCDLPDACELKQRATEVKSAWGGYPSYAPPLGWKVYQVSRPAGSSAETLNIEDTIWVDPSGVAYSVTSCAKGVTSSSEMSDLVIIQEKKTNHTWLLLGALGLLAYFTFKK